MAGKLTAIACDSKRRVLAGTGDGRVLEWVLDLWPQGRAFSGLEGSAVRALWASAGGALRMGTAEDGRVAVWDGRDGQLLASVECERPIRQCAAIGGGKFLLLEDAGFARVWSPGKPLSGPIQDTPGKVGRYGQTGVSVETGRMVLLTAFRWTVRNTETGTELDRHTALDGMDLNNADGLTGLSNNGLYYFIYWDDFAVFDIAEKRQLRSLDRPMQADAAALSDDGRRLAVGAESGRLVVIEPDGGLLVDTTPGRAPIAQVAVNHDGSVAAFLDLAGEGGAIDTTAGAGGKVLRFPVLP